MIGAARAARLRAALDAFLSSFDPAPRVAADPVSFPRRYPDPADREAAALFAALLAFGNVVAMRAGIGSALRRMGPRPAGWLARASARERRRRFSGFVYRWIRGEDLAFLASAAGRLLREHGSLRAAFARGLDPTGPDSEAALSAFARRLREGIPEGRGGRPRPIENLLADPARGSASKRWHMLLRWMARPDDGVDLGLWPDLPRAALLFPLDTHLFRIARCLGLTRRRTANLAAVREVTEGFRRADPGDPVRYDFALCHFGMEGGCHAAARRDCPLAPLCRGRVSSAAHG